jgi:hypothetical protein
VGPAGPSSGGGGGGVVIPASSRFVVTTDGQDTAYLIDSHYSGNNPILYVMGGSSVAFDLSGLGGSNPFSIQLDPNSGTFADITTGLTHVATDGVTVTTGSGAQGQTSGTLYWFVPLYSSGRYRYTCSTFPAMTGRIEHRSLAFLSTSIAPTRIEQWTQQGQVLSVDSSDYFGQTVSLSGNGQVLAIGATDADYTSVYDWSGKWWVQRGANIPGEASEDKFGSGVALSADGNVLAVGAWRNSS